MASRKDQVVPAINANNKNIFAASGGTLGVITRSNARAISAMFSTPTLTLPKEQEHLRHEPVITLAALRIPREESPMRYSKLLTSDANLSSSPYPVAMQVMTSGVTLIEEQLAQMSEAIAKLTRTVEEKNLPIVTLINRLEAQHDNNADPKVDPPKEETD
ncbi:hypothetical protein COP2_019455 [Malus domestica]